MGRARGPHQIKIRPGRAYRGSKARLDRISPLEWPPLEAWLYLVVALVMAGVTAAILYRAL